VFQRPEWTACNFRVFQFTEPYRFRTDMRFHQLLLRARFGRCSAEDDALLRGRLAVPGTPPECTQFSAIKATKFYSLKRDADQLNRRELAALPNPPKTFRATDTLEEPDDSPDNNNNAKSSKKYRRRQTPLTDNTGAWATMLDHAIPREIVLKVGAQVMLKKNLNVELGLVNGSRGVVKSISEDAFSVSVHFVNEMTIAVPLEMWSVGDAETRAVRRQIPLILAWGLTIHSSQGATLDKAECDIGHSVFAEGQAYVAMSRVRTLEGLSLSEYTPKAIKSNADAAAYVASVETERE
jgi:ATP-dependent DNA helicase PIF1